MKQLFILLLLSVIQLASVSKVQAQRFAYVNISSILEAQDDYKKAQTEVDQLAAKWQQEIEEQYDKIKGMYNAYQTNQVLLTDEMKKQKEEEIIAKEKEVRELQKSRFGPEGMLFKKRQDLIKPIQDKVYRTISSYASEKGFDFIFDKNTSAGIIFADARFDKTDDIIKKLKSE